MENIFDLEKKRNKQHIIGSAGVQIFQGTLPKGMYNIDFNEIPNQDDYGIDGQLQLFKLAKTKSCTYIHTGNFYYVQIKTSNTIKKLKDGENLSYTLPLSEARFIIEMVRVPTALIVVEETTKACFWYDIQTNNKFRKHYEKRITDYQSKPTPLKNPTISIHVPTENKLPNTWKNLLKYFEQASELLSKQNVIKSLKETSICSAFSNISAFEKETLELPNFIRLPRDRNAPPHPNAYLSLGDSEKMYDYIPQRDYSKQSIPPIEIQGELLNQLDGELGIKCLNSEQTLNSKISIGNRIIFDGSLCPGAKIQIYNQIKYEQAIMCFSTKKNDQLFSISVDIHQNGKNLFIKSNKDTELIKVRTKQNLKTDEVKYEIGRNEFAIQSIEEELFLVRSIKRAYQLTLSSNHKGIITKIGSIKIPVKMWFDEKWINLIEDLYSIEKATNTTIQTPLPNRMELYEVQNIHRLKILLEKGIRKENIYVHFTLEKIAKEKIEVGKYVKMVIDPFKLTIFNVSYPTPTYTLVIEGKIKSCERAGKDSNIYNIEVSGQEKLVKKC